MKSIDTLRKYLLICRITIVVCAILLLVVIFSVIASVNAPSGLENWSDLSLKVLLYSTRIVGTLFVVALALSIGLRFKIEKQEEHEELEAKISKLEQRLNNLDDYQDEEIAKIKKELRELHK